MLVPVFRKELEDDFSNSMDSYDDITFSDKDGKVYKTRKLYRISVDMSAIMRRACAVENPNVAN